MPLHRLPVVALLLLLSSGPLGASGTALRAPAVKAAAAAPPPTIGEEGWFPSAVARLSATRGRAWQTFEGAQKRLMLQLGFRQVPQGTEEPHIVVDQGVDSTEADAKKALLRGVVGFVTVLVWAGLAALLAQYYLNNKVHPSADIDPADTEALRTFRYGPFECFGRMDVSLWVCCCPAIRWADNVTTMGLLPNFWLAWMIWMGFSLVTGESQDLVALTVLAILGAMFRRELRLKFQMAATGVTFFQDCLLYCFCPCCAITQEARQVEDALRAGHPAIPKEMA